MKKNDFLVEVVNVNEGDTIIVHKEIGSLTHIRAREEMNRTRAETSEWIGKPVKVLAAPIKNGKRQLAVETIQNGSTVIINAEVGDMPNEQMIQYLQSLYRYLYSNRDVQCTNRFIVFPMRNGVKMYTLDDMTNFVDDAAVSGLFKKIEEEHESKMKEYSVKLEELEKAYVEKFTKLSGLKNEVEILEMTVKNLQATAKKEAKAEETAAQAEEKKETTEEPK